MPIGVPKVPFQFQNEPQIQWVNIYIRLSYERVRFIAEILETEIITQLIGLFMYLSLKNEKCDIFLYINSLGGSVSCGISLVDVMIYVKSNVCTINFGTANSTASFVVARGSSKKRLALIHSQFVIYQPMRGEKGQATEVLSVTKEVTSLRKMVCKLYAQFTGNTLSQIIIDLDRNTSINSKQADKYGLIDRVQLTILVFYIFNLDRVRKLNYDITILIYLVKKIGKTNFFTINT